MKLVQNNNLSIVSTSFHDTLVKLNPADLLRKFPKYLLGDQYKVSRVWIFEFNGNPFTVYDWKETSLYDTHLPPENLFWEQKLVELHVGSRSPKHEENEFVEELIRAISS